MAGDVGRRLSVIRVSLSQPPADIAGRSDQMMRPVCARMTIFWVAETRAAGDRNRVSKSQQPLRFAHRIDSCEYKYMMIIVAGPRRPPWRMNDGMPCICDDSSPGKMLCRGFDVPPQQSPHPLSVCGERDRVAVCQADAGRGVWSSRIVRSGDVPDSDIYRRIIYCARVCDGVLLSGC